LAEFATLKPVSFQWSACRWKPYPAPRSPVVSGLVMIAEVGPVSVIGAAAVPLVVSWKTPE
jgi:hypothetical protein